MRLFTGIAIPDEVKATLERLINRLQPCAQLHWSAPYNLHVTTKFIGDWPAERMEPLVAALREVRVGGPIDIEIRGLGWFPNPHRPRVFWAAVHAPAALSELAAATDQRLTVLGIQPEDRAYSPHLTLARVRGDVPLAPLREAIASLESIEFGRFTAPEYCLFRSEPGPSSSIYTKLAAFPLQAA